MLITHPHTHRITAIVTALMIALLALPAAASARPSDDIVGPRSHVVQPAEPTETVVRTVVREDAVRALPIVLAGAALLIAIGATGFVVVRTAPMRQQHLH
jgi:hypothetical protein